MSNKILTVHYIPKTISMVKRIICSIVYLICTAVAVYISGDSWFMSLITGAAFLIVLFLTLEGYSEKSANVFKTKEELIEWANKL